MAETRLEEPHLEENQEPDVQAIEEATNNVADKDDEILPSPPGSKPEVNISVQKDEEQPKPSVLKDFFGNIGLDVKTVLLMFKGSVAPVIGVAFYQANSVAATYETLGYLIPIITILNLPILPRAKYFQTMLINLLALCVGSSIALLGIWSAIQARKHTSSPGSTARYNSSQAAVCAIWLFVNIWFINVLRAKIPALQIPVMLYSIFTNIAFTYGPAFTTMIQGKQFVKELLEGFLTAFAISTGVHLVIVPISCRAVVFSEQSGYIQLIRATLKAQTAYLQSLERSDMFSPSDSGAESDKKKTKTKDSKRSNSHPAENLEAAKLKETLAALTTLHGKLHGDMTFAKREPAWGKLDAKDIDELFSLFRLILIPLIGMSTITDIFERIAERRGWVEVPKSAFNQAESWEDCSQAEKEEEKKTWNEIMKTLHEPFEKITAAMDEGMEHVGLVLEFIPKPKNKDAEDVEAKGSDPKPGDPGFAAYLDKKLQDFYEKRGESLKAWARQKGLSDDQFGSVTNPSDSDKAGTKHHRDRQQLYLILYLEHLLYSTGVSIGNLIKFADKTVEAGKMKKNRFIFPGKRTLKKWVMNIGQEDATVQSESPDSLEAGSHTIYMGAGFKPRLDPEHLPPQTAWEKFGNKIRVIPHFLGSNESAFGMRVACATMTIGIVAFLKDTALFFVEQRLVWAMIIIAIGMSMTSGQSIFGFFGRVFGTILAMVFSFIIWYIVDQKTPGIIVMLWLFIFMEMYFFLKYPRFLPIFLICMITQVLIIGYELQVRKIGIKAASQTGQPYYPIFELAPYRVACVAGGSFVAFIWTIFPYPLTDRSWLRKDLGSTLYLLANYYSITHSTIGARMHRTEGDMALKESPGRQLQKARHKVFGKLMLLLPSVKQHAEWQKWELSIGGKFPRETYDAIAVRVTNIMNYLSLLSYATMAWSLDDNAALYPNTAAEDRRKWVDDLSALVDVIGPTSHSITSILSLLSASVIQGAALPPYIQIPKPYNLSRRLEVLDKGILDAKHIHDPGYSAFAVMQILSTMVTDDLTRLVFHVKELVGETDFSFHVDTSQTSLDSTSTEQSSGKGKRD